MTGGLTAWHYDGRNALRRIVTVTRDGDSLYIESERVPLTDLVPRADDNRTVFGRRDNPGWRLGFDTPLPADWLAVLPRAERYGRLIDRIGLGWAIPAGIVFSALVLLGFWKAPELLAPLVPQTWERKLGDAIVGDMGGHACVEPRGQKILDALAVRLSQHGEPMRVRVVNIPIPNAVALPGGQIALFDGIIRQAQSPDEIAGVLAHEIGHVEKRHVMAGLIRQFGFGLLIGGNSRAGEYAQMLLDARYGREAERAADGYAIDHLVANRISPRPTADFFARMAKYEKTGNASMDTAFNWLSNHPDSIERRDAFRNADKKISAPRPALSAEDWKIVRSMCK